MGRFSSILHLGLALGLIATPAFAEFTIDEMLEATKIAMDEFQKDNPDHVDHFIGFKSWKSTDDAKVKVYISHDGMNMDFTYLCHKHSTKTECHAE